MKHTTLRTLIGAALCAGLLPPLNAEWHIISDFDDWTPDWDFEGGTMQDYMFYETDGHLRMRVRLPATVGSMPSLAGLGWRLSHDLLNGQTLETRLDVLQLSSGVRAFAGISHVSADERGNYVLLMNEEQVYLTKVDWQSGLVFAGLFHESLVIPTTDVVLSLARTRVGDSIQLTSRILDKADDDAVLFERTVIDSPEIDPTVDHFPDLDPLQRDSGPPYFRCSSVYVQLNQVTDGYQTYVEALYDNFRYETRSAPVLQIEKAVCLSWPASSTTFVVEGAATVEGPWQQISEPVFEHNGVSQVTVPAPLSETMKVFQLRAVEAP